jgi:hypothetical protein
MVCGDAGVRQHDNRGDGLFVWEVQRSINRGSVTKRIIALIRHHLVAAWNAFCVTACSRRG